MCTNYNLALFIHFYLTPNILIYQVALIIFFVGRCNHDQFPTPTDLCMLLTTPQWATFTMVVTTCVVYRVPLLMSQRKPTADWVKEMLVNHRVSCIELFC